MAVLQVDAVKPERLDQLVVSVDHQRDVMLVADFPQGVGGSADRILIRRRQGKPHAGDIERVKQAGQGIGKLRELELWRCDQIYLGLFAV